MPVEDSTRVRRVSVLDLPFQVPTVIAVCPICRGALTVTNVVPDAQGKAMASTLVVKCMQDERHKAFYRHCVGNKQWEWLPVLQEVHAWLWDYYHITDE